MRGCLFVLIFAAAVVSVVAWFGAPVLASSVIAASLQNGGFHAATSTVSATSNPPPKLLLGRADRVEIRGTDVDFRTFHAAGLDLVLRDVDLLGRRAGAISGRIDGAQLTTGEGATTSADVSVDGPADAAAARILVDAAAVDAAVKGALKAKFGVTATSTALVAPDVLRIAVRGASVQGRLVIDDSGAIALSTPLGSSVILRLDPSFPLALKSVHVVDGNLEVLATLDAQALLGG
jgi:hypothetical protein